MITKLKDLVGRIYIRGSHPRIDDWFVSERKWKTPSGEMRSHQISLKNAMLSKYIVWEEKVKCQCDCHTSNDVVHMQACCDGGWIYKVKEGLEIDSVLRAWEWPPAGGQEVMELMNKAIVREFENVLKPQVSGGFLRMKYPLAFDTIKIPLKYDKLGQIIFTADNQMLLDIRGWGYIQYMDQAEERQDQIGEFITELLNSAMVDLKNTDGSTYAKLLEVQKAFEAEGVFKGLDQLVSWGITGDESGEDIRRIADDYKSSIKNK